MRGMINYLAMALTVVACVGGLVYAVSSSIRGFDVAAAERDFQTLRPAVQAAIDRQFEDLGRASAPDGAAVEIAEPIHDLSMVGYSVMTRHDPFAVHSAKSVQAADEKVRIATSPRQVTRKIATRRTATAQSGRSAHPNARRNVQSASAHGAGSAGSYYMSSFRTKTAPYYRKPTMPRGMSSGPHRTTRHLNSAAR